MFFNPGTDCLSFLELKTILGLKNQHSAIRDLCVILGADPKDEHLVNCYNAKIDAGLQGSH